MIDWYRHARLLGFVGPKQMLHWVYEVRGLSAGQIARLLHVHRDSVLNALRANGFKIREGKR